VLQRARVKQRFVPIGEFYQYVGNLYQGGKLYQYAGNLMRLKAG